MNTLEALKPALLWKHFAAISAIPRCSRDETRVLDHLKALADAWGLSWSQDAVGNLVIRKPASPGREGSPVVVLQSHVDMVCEQNRGRGHDFTCDALELVVDGEWVRANETTLGADNGIGVAAILAVLEDGQLVHGPLEALFTIDEETALTGVTALDATLLTGKLLLNLDTEDEGHFTIGCAGGTTTWGEVPVSMTRPDAEAGWSVLVKGLSGGHSGVDIHRQLGNALKLGSRFVSAFVADQPQGEWQLAQLAGGDKHNAIPREVLIVLAGPDQGRAVLERVAQAARDLFARELGQAGDALVLEVASVPRPERVLTPASQALVLDLLAALPDGVQGMSKLVPGLVETSCNLAAVRIEDNRLHLLTSQRSSVQSLRDEAGRRIESAIRLAGGSSRNGSSYPAWSPSPTSPLRDKALALWKQSTGNEPVVELIHAGLECAVIGAKVDGMDMLSFGPDIRGAHTPAERVSIASVARFDAYLKALLKELV